MADALTHIARGTFFPEPTPETCARCGGAFNAEENRHYLRAPREWAVQQYLGPLHASCEPAAESLRSAAVTAEWVPPSPPSYVASDDDFATVLHRARRQVAYIRDKFIQVTHRESADLIELLADRLEPRTPSIHRASND